MSVVSHVPGTAASSLDPFSCHLFIAHLLGHKAASKLLIPGAMPWLLNQGSSWVIFGGPPLASAMEMRKDALYSLDMTSSIGQANVVCFMSLFSFYPILYLFPQSSSILLAKTSF
jgi:hypothetical protein